MKRFIVNTEKLKSNIEIVKKKADGRIIYGVLKGNGYGLGLLPLARILRDSGIDRFAVTEPADALRLRTAGYTDEEILVLRSVASESEAEEIIDAKATATIGSYADAVLLGGIAEKRGEIVEAHLKIDTGMGRYGFLPNEHERIVSIFKFMPKLHITGIYTHFACAFGDSKKTKHQLIELLSEVERLKSEGYDPGIVHAANSPYLFRFDLTGTDAVRIGSAFTGRVVGTKNTGLKPVSRISCEVCQIRWLPRGHSVGYGCAYVTNKPTRIAVVPVGYADGYQLARDRDIFRFRDKLRYIWGDIKLLLKNKTLYVTVDGKRAKVLGHVGMLHTAVDVSNIECTEKSVVNFDVNPLVVSQTMERIYE